jgi:hypothetical protein
MDITLGQVVSVALIQHSRDGAFGEQCTTMVIKTEKGEVRIDMFSKGPIALKLGSNEDD